MRHAYIRGILALIWLMAGIFCGVSGALGTAALYVVLGLVFAYSAYSLWKKGEDGKEGK